MLSTPDSIDFFVWKTFELNSNICIVKLLLFCCLHNFSRESPSVSTRTPKDKHQVSTKQFSPKNVCRKDNYHLDSHHTIRHVTFPGYFLPVFEKAVQVSRKFSNLYWLDLNSFLFQGAEACKSCTGTVVGEEESPNLPCLRQRQNCLKHSSSRCEVIFTE